MGGTGEGTKAKLKIKWCDLHYKSITLWHLHIVYLCNSKIFFYHPHISIWTCINMYKSLLRKNRIPSAALESLKGALSCFNFCSCPYGTVSISVEGALYQLAPTKAQASSTLCPMIHRYSSPQWNEWGERSLVKTLPVSWGRARRSLMRVMSSIPVKQVGEQQHGLLISH